MSEQSDRLHQCKVPGCAVWIVKSLLMCPGHWRLVPPDLQQKVSATWRRFTRPARQNANIPSALASWRAYSLARNAAIEAIRQHGDQQ